MKYLKIVICVALIGSLLLCTASVAEEKFDDYEITEQILLTEKLEIQKSSGCITEMIEGTSGEVEKVAIDDMVYTVGKVHMDDFVKGDQVTIYYRSAENDNTRENILLYIHKEKDLSQQEMLELLYALGIVKGYDDSRYFTFESPLTRVEFTAMVVRVMGCGAPGNTVTTFSDVPMEHWASGYVQTASHIGIINGYGNNKFGPEDLVTYEQAIAMVVRALGYSSVASHKGGYPVGYNAVAEELGIVDNKYDITNLPATMGQVVEMIFKSLTVPIMVQIGYKPVIYLYPETESKVSVKLNLKGKFIYTSPEYDNGWEVIARPDGSLINIKDNGEYPYLFWEGSLSNVQWDLSKGFVVEGEKTTEFLRNTLEAMGLTPKEYSEFIVYWAPKMQKNKYNLITFASWEYEDAAPLEISPRPDSMLRVFMVYKGLNEPLDIQPQQIRPFERKGFTVVEWGGTEIKY